jgi:ribonucleoside-diphosphate reductase alpha chain
MIQVQKRDGTREALDINKFHKVAEYACEGLSGVSVSDLEIKTHIQFYNGIKSADIQETLIKAAADLISEEAPNYQYVAGRLINYNLRKQVYGSYEPRPLYSHYIHVLDDGYYDTGLGVAYELGDWMELEKYIVREYGDKTTPPYGHPSKGEEPTTPVFDHPSEGGEFAHSISNNPIGKFSCRLYRS